MNFKNWLITEEIYQNGTATVYHRTNKENIQNILSNNWKVGGGQMYGAGLYTTFALKSQFTKYMSNYGDALLKFKVKDLNKYVICSTGVARHILGDEYKIGDQLKNLNLSDLYTEEQIKNFDEMMLKEVYSSAIALKMFNTNSNLQRRAKGIIYYGKNDGYCLVKYEPIEDGTITLLGYAKVGNNETAKIDALLSNCEKDQEGKCQNPWTTSTGLLKIKTLHGLPAEKKQSYATIKNQYNDFEKIISEPNTNFQKIKFYFARNKELINDLSDNNVYNLLYNATNKDELANFIIQNKKDLTDNNVYNLLDYAPNKDEIANLIIQNKKDLTSSNVKVLLDYTTNKDEIANLIIQNKKDLTDDDVYNLLMYAINKDKIAKLIMQNKKNLNDNNVYYLLIYAENPYEMSKLFGSENINKLISGNFDNLLDYATNKDEMAKLIIQNKKYLTSRNVFDLLKHATNKEEIAKLLGSENINKLSDVSVGDWLRSATNPDEAAKVVIQYIKDLTDDDVYNLLKYTTNKDEIAKLIIQYIKDLTFDNVYYLLRYATNKDEIAKLIIQNKKDLADKDVFQLLRYATNKDEIAHLLGSENINKLSDDRVRNLLAIAPNPDEIRSILQKYGRIQ